MSRVLVPYDGSEQSETALEYAINEFESDEITLLYVIQPPESQMSVPGMTEEWYEHAEEEAEALFEDARELAAEHDVELAETVTESGHPKRVIPSYADENDIDHIVMGSHGREGSARILLGSVAETVVRRAPVPVTVVR